MEETLIWATGLIAEILLAITVALAVLLRRSRKAQRQLVAQLADREKHTAEHVDLAETSKEIHDAPEIESRASEPSDFEAPETKTGPVQTTSASLGNEFAQLLASIDNADLDGPAQRLQQRLEASTQSLQRLASELQQELPGSEQGRVEFASLQVNLQEMTAEVGSLQQNNAQLQQDLRSKTKVMERTVAEAREQTEMVLQHARKLRGDISTLRDKLKGSEGDVQRLQTEKDALATEYAALNKEYERIYSSSHK